MNQCANRHKWPYPPAGLLGGLAGPVACTITSRTGQGPAVTTWLSPPLRKQGRWERKAVPRACPIRNHGFAESTGHFQCTCQSLTLAGSISLPRMPHPTSIWIPQLGTWVSYSSEALFP